MYAGLPDTSGITTGKAFMVFGVVFLVLIGLFLIRYGILFLLEVVLLRHIPERRREAIRRLIPFSQRWISPPLNTQSPSELTPSPIPWGRILGSSDASSNLNGTSFPNHRVNDNFDILFDMTTEQRHEILSKFDSIQDILNQILPGKVITEHDLRTFRDKLLSKSPLSNNNVLEKDQVLIHSDSIRDTSSNEAHVQVNDSNTSKIIAKNEDEHDYCFVLNENLDFLCSICIQEIVAGDSVYVSNYCNNHTFHADCIRLWVGKPALNAEYNHQQRNIYINNHCPNCRTQLFVNINEILGLIQHHA